MVTDRCSRVVRPIAAPQLKQLMEQSRAHPKSVTFVKFASAFCHACQESRKAIDQAIKASPTCLEVAELDADIAGGAADGFNIRSLPTMVAIKGGQVVGKVEGAQEVGGYMRFFKKHSEG